MDLTDNAIPTAARAARCGPLPFMRAIHARLIERGVPAADIHYEDFGPDLWLGGELPGGSCRPDGSGAAS
ncbi:hypothetical protein [Embleya sp. NPDC020630]|uniref:hypothetical protein n=1 Tax=Embleya sp. NPDC020630 TaxID=3363979 RepID=UPI00378A4688